MNMDHSDKLIFSILWLGWHSVLSQVVNLFDHHH